MKQNAVIVLISFLVVGAAVVVAHLISANGESKIPIASTLISGDTEQLVTADPEQGKGDPQIPADSAKTEQTSQEIAVNVVPEQSATTTGPDKSAVLSPDAKAAITAEKPGKAEREETLAPSRVSQVTKPAPPSAEKNANVHLISVDTPPMPSSLYEAALWHPLHFKPAIDTATNEQCLACHGEILSRKVLETSPAGVKAADSLAWYQTLDTYTGDQMTLHQRHMTSTSSPFARQVMDLKCNFCHQGHDPREEAPSSSATAPSTKEAAFTLRKVVNSSTCLLCHGKFPYEIMALEGPWHKVRGDLEDPKDPDLRNGCLTCHNPEGGFRSVRHQVSYLKADEIERLAKEGSSDVCYGCHGGRQWYRIAYPYPRHTWPGMDPEVPDWAKDRPTQSDPRFALEKQ